MAVSAGLAAGVARPGVAAVSAGVLTGEGAFGAGVSTPPNENPDLAPGVVVAGAGAADVESFAASLVAPPKLNPPDAAGAAVDSAGLGAAAPPNENPPKL